MDARHLNRLGAVILASELHAPFRVAMFDRIQAGRLCCFTLRGPNPEVQGLACFDVELVESNVIEISHLRYDVSVSVTQCLVPVDGRCIRGRSDADVDRR